MSLQNVFDERCYWKNIDSNTANEIKENIEHHYDDTICVLELPDRDSWFDVIMIETDWDGSSAIGYRRAADTYTLDYLGERFDAENCTLDEFAKEIAENLDIPKWKITDWVQKKRKKYIKNTKEKDCVLIRQEVMDSIKSDVDTIETMVLDYHAKKCDKIIHDILNQC